MSARVRHALITLDGTAQQLFIPGASKVGLRQISIQADKDNTHVFYIGGEGVSATEFGVQIPIPASNVPAAPFVLEFEDGGLELGDYYVFGTSTEKVRLLVMAYV